MKQKQTYFLILVFGLFVSSIQYIQISDTPSILAQKKTKEPDSQFMKIVKKKFTHHNGLKQYKVREDKHIFSYDSNNKIYLDLKELTPEELVIFENLVLKQGYDLDKDEFYYDFIEAEQAFYDNEEEDPTLIDEEEQDFSILDFIDELISDKENSQILDETDEAEQEDESESSHKFYQQEDGIYLDGKRLNSFQNFVLLDVQRKKPSKYWLDHELELYQTYKNEITLRTAQQNKFEEYQGDKFIFGYQLTPNQAQQLNLAGPLCIVKKDGQYQIGGEAVPNKIAQLIMENYDYQDGVQVSKEQRDREKILYDILNTPNPQIMPKDIEPREWGQIQNGTQTLVDLDNIPEDDDDFIYYGPTHKEEKRKHYERVNQQILKEQQQKSSVQKINEDVQKEPEGGQRIKIRQTSEGLNFGQFLISKSEWEVIQEQAKRKYEQRRKGK